MCYDAGAMTVWGVLAIDAMTSAVAGPIFGSASGFSTIVWGDAIAAVVLGLFMVVAALLTTYARSTMRILGGLLGLACSVGGALVTVEWLSSVSAVAFAGSNFAYTYTAIGLPAVLFAGFPLGLMGSIGALRNDLAENAPLPNPDEARA